MLQSTVLPGHPARVAIELTAAQIAASAHALHLSRDGRFRLAEMTADDAVTLREVTAAVDALDAEAGHGEAATVVLSAARLLLLAAATRELAEHAAQADVVREADHLHGRVAAGLVDPLADLAQRALASALDEEGADDDEPHWDDDALDALLRGE